jgi:general secretion pathway protein D
MNKKYSYIVFCISIVSNITLPLYALQDNEAITVKNILNTKLNKSPEEQKEKMVWFKYDDVPLATIVNELATQLNINIMLPGATTLTTKVTFEFSHKIPLKKAWQYVITLLKISGFTIVPHVGFSSVVKNDANTNKEPLPLFVNTPTASLPKTDLKIRYLRYLTNILVPEGQASGGYGGGSASPLQAILKDVLSADAQLIFEPQLNAMVITDYATNIKSVMEIVDELDSSTIVQDMKLFRLEYTSAAHVKTLFDALIGATSTSGSSPQPQVPNNSGYFAQTTKVVPINRTNSLVLLGKKDALIRVIKFIKSNIDIPIEEGKSILHIYDLKHLKADSFAATLRAIVQNSTTAGAGQSTSSSGKQNKIYFEGVIIASETSSSGTGGGGDGTIHQGAQGGNRLIIAAMERDWLRIEKLIKELDRPRMQVAIQGLIVDLTTEKIKSLASQIRNHSNLFFKDVKAQSANIGDIYHESTAIGLESNLLSAATTPDASELGAAKEGSTIISVAEAGTNGIWLLTKMLQNSSDAKILSQPYLTTTNHKQVNFTSSEKRYVKGAAEPYQSSGTTQHFEPIEASLIVNVLPTISEDRIINLGIFVKVDEFTSSAATQEAQEGNTNNRQVTTNANINSGEILVIGGLSKTKITAQKKGTPFLDKVPIINHLFSSKEQKIEKSELMIFLRAEIIDNTQQSSREFARYKTDEALDLLGLAGNKDENFSQLRDPITHWFFGDEKKEITKAVSLYKESIALDQENVTSEIQLDNKKTSSPLLQKEATSMKIQENIVFKKDSLKKQSPSQIKKLSKPDEEKQAEEELRKLFDWDNKIISEKNKKSIAKKQKEVKTFKKQLESGAQAKNSSVSEEKKAQQKLQAMFQSIETLDETIIA